MCKNGCHGSLEITLSRYLDQFSAQIILLFIYPNQSWEKTFDNFSSKTQNKQIASFYYGTSKYNWSNEEKEA